MKIALFNGSPRGKASNSNVLLDFIIEGIGETHEKHVVKNLRERPSHLETVQSSDTIVIVLPLYTDAMPGVVMDFLEAIGTIKDGLKNKRFLFVVHSGFPEGRQSFPLRDYLVHYSEKLGVHLIDVIIMGGSEGVRLMPPAMLKKKRACFNGIGRSIKAHDAIDPNVKAQLLKPVELSAGARKRYKLMQLAGLSNIYWDRQLKENNVYDQRFDKPYVD